MKAQEYTNATTTQLVNPETGDWNRAMIQKLGYPEKIFLPIREPGTVIGHLKKEIREQVGFDCEIVLPATHDTGSAVVAVPSNEEHVLYISSGTWSLMGTELKEADCGTEAMQHNFTNEGGYNRKYRFLKNIMGLWMVQSVKKEIAEDLSFGTICEMASKCTIPSIVDANDDRFLAPENMTAEVQKACEESGQQIPQGIAEVAAVIYNSLAVCYAKTLKELEEQTGCRYRTIHVVGGGANADYLNRLTAEKTGRTVLAGPTEIPFRIGQWYAVNLALLPVHFKCCSILFMVFQSNTKFFNGTFFRRINICKSKVRLQLFKKLPQFSVGILYHKTAVRPDNVVIHQLVFILQGKEISDILQRHGCYQPGAHIAVLHRIGGIDAKQDHFVFSRINTNGNSLFPLQ